MAISKKLRSSIFVTMLVFSACSVQVEPLFQKKIEEKKLGSIMSKICLDLSQNDLVEKVRHLLVFKISNLKICQPTSPYRLILSATDPIDDYVGSKMEDVNLFSYEKISFLHFFINYQLVTSKKAVLLEGQKKAVISVERGLSEYAGLQAKKLAQKQAAVHLAEDLFLMLNEIDARSFKNRDF